MRLTVVGCTGSVPGPVSASSCYLVEAPDDRGRTWRVLLDLGSGALGPLQLYCDPRRIDAVLLSHLHADHCLDLTAMYVMRRYHPLAGGSTGAPLAVWGPSGVAGRITAAYDPGMDSDDDAGTDLSDQLDFHEWIARDGVDIGPLHVEPIEVDHPVEAYGMRITWRPTPGGRPVVLGYSGDTDDCGGLDVIAADADLFVCEATFVEGRDEVTGLHLTGRGAGGVAARTGARSLLLTHIPPWHDAGRAGRDAAQVYDGPIELAVPGLVVDLD